MLNKEDFDRMQFPSSWYYYLNKNGEGQVSNKSETSAEKVTKTLY